MPVLAYEKSHIRNIFKDTDKKWGRVADSHKHISEFTSERRDGAAVEWIWVPFIVFRAAGGTLSTG